MMAGHHRRAAFMLAMGRRQMNAIVERTARHISGTPSPAHCYCTLYKNPQTSQVKNSHDERVCKKTRRRNAARSYSSTAYRVAESVDVETARRVPIDYARFINGYSSRRRPAVTRELTKMHYASQGNGTDSISLAEGMPNDSTFPFDRIAVNLKDGSSFVLDGKELGAALQYIPSQGYPSLVATLKQFTEHVHRPPNWHATDLLVTNGSQDGISKSLEMILEEGDDVLVQNPLYSGTETVLKPLNVNLIAIEQDGDGLIPDHLEATLRDRRRRLLGRDGVPLTEDERRLLDKRMPKVLYVNPTAANPTGTTIPIDRRRRIYEICSDHDVVILEDDAYYFMRFDEDSNANSSHLSSTLQSFLPSFLALDVDGRVLRFDSLSKTLSSGLRIGWVTGPKPLINNLELHVQSSYLHSSTLSQVIADKLLRTWGHDRLMEHFARTRAFYKDRRDFTLRAMRRHLDGLCDWSVPSGGMFVWIRVRDVDDVHEMLIGRGVVEKSVTFVPGHAFMADPQKPCNYVRASYSLATPDQIDVAMSRLAELVREEIALRKTRERRRRN